METPAARRRGGDGGGGFQQGFAKHRGKTKMDVGEGGQHRGTNVCGCPPSASLYIGGVEGRGRPRVSPRGAGGKGRGGAAAKGCARP